MCKRKHTKEPWYVVGVDNSYEIFSESEDYDVAWSIDSEANAERIVACVNACAGVPSEDLLKVVAFGKEHVERMRKLEGKEPSEDTFEYNIEKLGEGYGY